MSDQPQIDRHKQNDSPHPLGLPSLDNPDNFPKIKAGRPPHNISIATHGTPVANSHDHLNAAPIGKLSTAQACQLSQAERLDLLMRFNKMSSPIVVGTITQSTPGTKWPFWLRRLKTIDGRSIEIPIQGAQLSPQVPIDHQPDIVAGSIVQQEINTVPNNSPEFFRKNKPFALMAVGKANVHSRLASVVKDANGDVLISESILKSQLAGMDKDLEREKRKHDDNVLQLQKVFSEEKAKSDRDIQTLRSGIQKENEALTLLREAKESAHSEWREVELQVVEAKIEAQNELIKVDHLIADARKAHAVLVKQKESAMSAYIQLLDYAKDKASLLQSLDLISSDQYEDLCGSGKVYEKPKDVYSWTDDLKMEYPRLVSTIHSYLLSEGIIYPRWLVANFLTLLRTNDLIILSGLSGSGKTQIVRSFADALGGKAHIMPVKPNWTGAEDLLGFFNPLQRSYVRTPFLEALLEAQKDPHRLHLICLDEMNLARAEYYFADFLSKLEKRNEPARIPLYSEHEANHIQSEVRMLLAALRGDELLTGSTEGYAGVFDKMFKDPDVMSRIREMFGENAAESLPAFHGRVRKALSTVLDIPTNLTIPANVRFIGAINVDQTTYGLSPKILDRAHVLRFENPLHYSAAEIEEEASKHMKDVPNQRPAPIYMPPSAFDPQRDDYPKFDASHPAAILLVEWQKEYLTPLGMDVAYRTIRQAQLYWDLLKEVFPADNHEAVAKNLLVLQKILPKFTVDGKVKAKFGDSQTLKDRFDIAGTIESALGEEETISPSNIHPNAAEEIHRIRMAAEANDKIFNYWA